MPASNTLTNKHIDCSTLRHWKQDPLTEGAAVYKIFPLLEIA